MGYNVGSGRTHRQKGQHMTGLIGDECNVWLVVALLVLVLGLGGALLTAIRNSDTGARQTR